MGTVALKDLVRGERFHHPKTNALLEITYVHQPIKGNCNLEVRHVGTNRGVAQLMMPEGMMVKQAQGAK